MKLILTLVVCSAVHASCLHPMVRVDSTYTNWADCMRAGYEDSLKMMTELGDDRLNEMQTFIKFVCAPMPSTEKKDT